MNANKIKNAVIFKEVTLTMKHNKTILVITIFNALLALAGLVVVGAFALSAAAVSAISYTAILWIYIGFVAAECLIIAFVVPALTAGTISGERERQTLEVLLTTKMSTWQIIWGKYISAILSVVLVIISAIPFMALVFIYGGIALWQMLAIAGIIILAAMYMAAFGIWFSTLTKKTLTATVLSYLWMVILLSLSIGLPIAMCSSLSATNYLIYYNSNYVTTPDMLPVAPPLMLMYVNPLVTIFDAIGHIIGYTIDGETFKGMYQIVSALDIPGYKVLAVGFRFWTPISLMVQMAIAYGFLAWSANLLNPLRGNRAHLKQTKKAMKRMEKQSEAKSEK